MANNVQTLMEFNGVGAHEFLLTLLDDSQRIDFYKIKPILPRCDDVLIKKSLSLRQELWGTPYDPYDTCFYGITTGKDCFELEELKEHEVTEIGFQTAWGAPLGIWEKIATLMPNHLTAKIVFADEDDDNVSGAYKIVGNELIACSLSLMKNEINDFSGSVINFNEDVMNLIKV